MHRESRRQLPARKPRPLFRAIAVILSGLLLIPLLWLNVRLHAVPEGAAVRGGFAEDAVAQLKGIGRRLRAGEGRDMQRLFPEGSFFSHAVYGMAWINVGLQTRDPELKRRSAEEVRWVLQRLDTPEERGPFRASTQVDNGVFYLGWRNRLLGGLLALRPEPAPTDGEVSTFQRQSRQLAEAYRTTPTLHLDAYPGQAWPCDNVMALASLRLHDTLFEPQYGDVLQDWVSFSRRHLDPETGLIVHRIDGSTGRLLEAARASSLMYVLALLPEVDANLAQEQYAKFRSLFVQDWLGYLPVREYPKGRSGEGDVDTGPLILGISPSATVASIAAARSNGDFELAERTVILSETLGVPWTSGGEKNFGFGLMVVGDAFLVWGKTLVPWTPVPEPTYPATTPGWWKWRIHGISLVITSVLVLVARKRPRV